MLGEASGGFSSLGKKRNNEEKRFFWWAGGGVCQLTQESFEVLGRDWVWLLGASRAVIDHADAGVTYASSP